LPSGKPVHFLETTMNHREFLRRACAFAAASMLCTTVQAAGLFRAYLSSAGSDSNPCTLPSPCRLLPAALAAVADGGEIWILDSANFNTTQVNITKSVTILAIPGAVGSVIATSGGDAININAAGVSVTLRNLVLVPIAGGGGVNGVVMSDGARLTVENGVIYNFSAGHGIRVTNSATVRIVNTLIRDNAFGIWLQGGVTADISGTKILGSGQFGIRVNGNVGGVTATAAVTDTVVTGSGGYGITAYADNLTANSRISVIRSTITNNLVGIRSDAFLGAVLVSVSECMVTGNGKAFSQVGVGATLESLGNNTVRQNTGPDEGSVTTVSTS
jgi:hypothetical protein